MGRWLALARADVDEKNAKTPADGTLKTLKTHVDEVSRVLKVPQTAVSEKFSAPAEAGSIGFEGFEGSQKGAFSEISPALRSAPEPDARSQVAEAETPEAAIARLLDAMATENERRRGWQDKPIEGWRDGRLTMRSAMTGEEITIHHPRGRTRH